MYSWPMDTIYSLSSLMHNWPMDMSRDCIILLPTMPIWS